MARPVKYSNPDEMQTIIDQYFEDCVYNRAESLGVKSDVPRETITDDLHPTISGLALVLDLVRQSLINYEGKPEFLDTIKKAKARVEGYVEQRLFYQNPAGCIFNLKNNFGWKDQQDHKIQAEVNLHTIERKIVDSK